MKTDVGVTPLARTLFDLAVEHDAVDSVIEDLEVVQRTLDHHLKLKDTLRNSQIVLEAKDSLIGTIFGDRVSPATLSFLRLLVRVGTISMLADIRKVYGALAAEARKTVVADVTTAVALDADTESKLAARLAEVAGKPVRLRHRVDPSILGGMIVRLDDEVLDASLSHQLSALRAKLGG